LILNIDSSKLTEAPYTADRKKSFLIENNDDIDQVVLELRHASPSSFLISGYRGVGKTSFANRIAEQLNKDFIYVNINVAKYNGYPTLIKKLIRELYTKFDLFVGEEKLTGEKKTLNEEFKLLYDRTFNDIVNSHIINSKKEQKISSDLELNLRKLMPIIFTLATATGVCFDWMASKVFGYLLFVAGLIWACIASFKLNFSVSKSDASTNETSRKSLYDDDIAEHHLLNTLQKLHNHGYKILIAFDELDKIEKIETVQGMIGDLKFLLLSGYANFFVIAGQELFYELVKSDYKDNQVISTLFSKTLHVPFLKSATLKKYCFGLLKDESKKSEALVNMYFDFVILRSSRVPRKLVNIIRAHLQWNQGQAYLSLEEDAEIFFRRESQVGEVLSKLMDSRLFEIARNQVQLDFFIAQIYLWISKMREYHEGGFFLSSIINIDSYKGIYPDSYVAQLDPLKELLMAELLEKGILTTKETISTEEQVFAWGPYSPPSIPDSEGPDSGDEGIGPEDVEDSTIMPPVSPSFVSDFAEFEEFLRQVYTEFDPDDSNKKRTMRGLVNRLIEMGILKQTWYNSNQIEELVKTRNNVLHGQAMSAEDLNTIQKSIFTLSRLKSEVIEDITLYITQRYLQSFRVEKDKAEYDFIASRNNDMILFEVKYMQAGLGDTRNVDEIINKYTNFIAGTGRSMNIYYVLFFFQPNRRKSFDDFYIKFNDIVGEDHPKLKNKLNLYYVSEASELGIKGSIEKYLKEVLLKFGPRTDALFSYFDEFELEATEKIIKEKSLSEWPDDYTMQASVIQEQQKAVESLKKLDTNELPDDIFKKLKDKSKSEYPRDFVMQLHVFQEQRSAYKKVNELAPGKLPGGLFNKILSKAKSSWPNDYVMQLYEFEEQRDAAISLNPPKEDNSEDE
jgi:Cdc6-like AAA superfamily ATPase